MKDELSKRPGFVDWFGRVEQPGDRGLIEEKVKVASIVSEIVHKHPPYLKTSGRRAPDLVLPYPA